MDQLRDVLPSTLYDRMRQIAAPRAIPMTGDAWDNVAFEHVEVFSSRLYAAACGFAKTHFPSDVTPLITIARRVQTACLHSPACRSPVAKLMFAAIACCYFRPSGPVHEKLCKPLA